MGIDFEERALALLPDGYWHDHPMVKQHAQALRQLAADVLEEVASVAWCNRDAERLRTRAREIQEGK